MLSSEGQSSRHMLRNSDISHKTRVSVGQIPYESRRNALLCALLVGACVLLAFPVATTAASDDFSYSKTALEFARTGHFRYNGWATAMLGWQIAWGAFFIKLFGFSFTCLRLSTAPVAMATVYLLHQILVRFRIRSHNAVNRRTYSRPLSTVLLPGRDIPYGCSRNVRAGPLSLHVPARNPGS